MVSRSIQSITTTCMDVSGWYDSGGTDYTCSWYGSNSNYCGSYGNSYTNFGYTANQACCVCGGGIRSTTAIPAWILVVPIVFFIFFYGVVKIQRRHGNTIPVRVGTPLQVGGTIQTRKERILSSIIHKVRYIIYTLLVSFIIFVVTKYSTLYLTESITKS